MSEETPQRNWKILLRGYHDGIYSITDIVENTGLPVYDVYKLIGEDAVDKDVREGDLGGLRSKRRKEHHGKGNKRHKITD